MADTKNALYTVKHIDGVMHLTINPEAKAEAAATTLRPLPPAIEKVEN